MSNYHPFLNALVSIGACLAVTAISLPANAQLAQSGTCSASSDAPIAVEKELDGVLSQMLESTHGSAPGAVLSVRTDDWRYIAAAGFADPEAGLPMDCASPFQIGSNTKMMTAVVLLQLLEEGRLGLDDPLSRHLPEIAARLPNGEAMTLRQLSRHTSGVFSYTDNAPDGTPGLMEGGLTDRAALLRQIDPHDMVDFVVEHGAPNFLPDAQGAWSYSNTGYALLGLVIEKLDGQPLEKSFEERIFEPARYGPHLSVEGYPERRVRTATRVFRRNRQRDDGLELVAGMGCGRRHFDSRRHACLHRGVGRG